jgi:Protein of unknown function (DUF4240)
MNERSAFWSLIDETRAESDDDLERQAELLTDRLAGLEPEQIVEFARIWREKSVAAYNWNLWAAAYVINGGCSDDCFDYFRDYLISRGRETYEAAVADRDSIDVPSYDDVDYELVSYSAYYAYERATGEELPRVGPHPPAEPRGERWDEDSVRSVVPNLARRHGF